MPNLFEFSSHALPLSPVDLLAPPTLGLVASFVLRGYAQEQSHMSLLASRSQQVNATY
jgi:hypothetical protein